MEQTHKGRGRQAAIGFFVFLFSCIILMWSWNSLLVETFSVKAIQFKHAVAIELLLMAFVGTIVVAARLFMPSLAQK